MSHLATTRRGAHDPALRARICERRALHFTPRPSGAGPTPPPHVRAASSVALFQGRLAVFQDDARWLALVEPHHAAVEAWPLPPDALGRRVSVKAHKLDLEACAVLPVDGDESLLAFGSGSTPARERIVVVHRDGRTELLEAPAFYAHLRSTTAFSGSELNLEGVVFEPPDGLRLVQRGNGAPRGELTPVDATAALSWQALWRHLRAPAEHALEPLRAIEQHALGELDGVRLTLTDGASAPGGGMLLLATAEDSPDTYQDGRVAGSALAIAAPDGAPVRWAPLEASDGSLPALKAEGICLDPDDPRRAWLVHDPDDPATPAELLVVELSGPWW